MSRIYYDTVETLVYDPVTANRAATRSALYMMGFRTIETVATLDAFNSYIKRRPPDLAICEAHGAERELSQSIQALRHGLIAHNPFLVVIVTAWENHTSLVNQMINSGADDLVLRPFSTTLLEQRIRIHVERRKGFVITSDYVGPDRRHNSARSADTELFQPPNSLKMKAKERITPEEAAQRLDEELKVARELLVSEKLRRDAFQIGVEWRQMQNKADWKGDGPQASCAAELARLQTMAKGVARRARDTEYEDAVEWCDSILSAIEGLEMGVDRNASMHLLGHAALSLNQVFSPGKTRDESLAEIDATLASLEERRQTAIAS